MAGQRGPRRGDQATRLSVFVPGVADLAKATQVARALAEKAPSRMN